MWGFLGESVILYYYGASFQILTTLHIFCMVDLKWKIQEENVLVESYSEHLLPYDMKGAFI